MIDHLTITAPTLERGAELVESALGVGLQVGGEHPKMGTHNLLLRLGDAVFLEVIATNPAARRPERPRWFALDRLAADTPAALKTWVVRTADLPASLDGVSPSLGKIEALSRGSFAWLITIPEDGGLPMHGAAPALVEWQSETHPAATLVDHGLSLLELQIHHPEVQRVQALLDAIGFDGAVRVINSPVTRLVARIDTPQGIRQLGG